MCGISCSLSKGPGPMNKTGLIISKYSLIAKSPIKDNKDRTGSRKCPAKRESSGIASYENSVSAVLTWYSPNVAPPYTNRIDVN